LPRTRSRRNKQDDVVSADVLSVENTTANNGSRSQGEKNTMSSVAVQAGTKVLDPARIQELLSDTRTRGEYDTVLENFVESGETGIEVEFTGPLAGKDATNVYTGLNNARKRQTKEGNLVHEWGPNIRVIKKNLGTKETPDEHVFLINTALVEGMTGGAEDDGEVEE